MQYTSLDYVTTALNANASLSYSKKAEPGDNAVNETFFSRLKEEWREIFAEAKSFEELEQLINNAIEYYNERRYHTSINNLTPLEFTKAQAQSVGYRRSNKLKLENEELKRLIGELTLDMSLGKKIKLVHRAEIKSIRSEALGVNRKNLQKK